MLADSDPCHEVTTESRAEVEACIGYGHVGVPLRRRRTFCRAAQMSATLVPVIAKRKHHPLTAFFCDACGAQVQRCLENCPSTAAQAERFPNAELT